MARDIVRVSSIDQEARDLANRALSLIETHERVATEAQREANTWRVGATAKLRDIESTFNGGVNDLKVSLENVEKSIDGVYSRLWIGASGLIMVLLAVIGYVIAHKGL